MNDQCEHCADGDGYWCMVCVERMLSKNRELNEHLRLAREMRDHHGDKRVELEKQLEHIDAVRRSAEACMLHLGADRKRLLDFIGIERMPNENEDIMQMPLKDMDVQTVGELVRAIVPSYDPTTTSVTLVDEEADPC